MHPAVASVIVCASLAIVCSASHTLTDTLIRATHTHERQHPVRISVGFGMYLRGTETLVVSDEVMLGDQRCVAVAGDTWRCGSKHAAREFVCRCTIWTSHQLGLPECIRWSCSGKSAALCPGLGMCRAIVRCRDFFPEGSGCLTLTWRAWALNASQAKSVTGHGECITPGPGNCRERELIQQDDS